MPKTNRPTLSRGTMGACNRARILATCSVMVAVLAVAAAAQDAPDDAAAPGPWDALRLLEGDWEAEIGGRLGTGRGIRSYDWLREDGFLRVRHRSVRLPQEKSPAGDVHEELAVFTFDRQRGTIVYRESFMMEGIVVHSSCNTESRKITCISESVEGGPGIRARLTLEVESRYRFVETYEIAWPGKELEHYFTNRWTRSPESFAWD